MADISLRVTDIQGVEHIFTVSEDNEESILDIADRNGIMLPFSCRSGACYSCCAEVSQGKEYLDANKTGEQLIDIESNEFLTCIGGCTASAFQQQEPVEIVMKMMN